MIEKAFKIKELEDKLQSENENLQLVIERIIQDYRNKAHSDINTMYHQLELDHENMKQKTVEISQENHQIRLKEVETKLELLEKIYIKKKDAAIQSVIEEVFRYGNS